MINNLFIKGRWWVPHPLHYASRDGFVAWMDMTNPEQLLDFYHYGLFPWENFGPDGAFFFPHKRYLIKPSEIKIQRSMRPYFNQGKFQISFDYAFKEVMQSCQMVKRKGTSGTWISETFIDTYSKLHSMGYAHSVEVWEDDYLVGGLYGVSIGKIFTGESMFSVKPNASKFALISLALELAKRNFWYIDCQINNHFLEQFGGNDVSGKEFFAILRKNYFESSLVGNWGTLFSQDI